MSPDPISEALARDARAGELRRALVAAALLAALLIVAMFVAGALQARSDSRRTDGIVRSLRLSNDCLALRAEGQRPPGCVAVNERVDALGRGEEPDFLAP